MVKKFDIYFPPAQENRRIHLYLPDEYEYTQERYPVVYMFDGHNLYFDSDATFGKSLGLKEFLDGWNKKLIVVGMECASDDWVRVQEYCPYHIQSRIYGEIKGRGHETMEWVVHTVKPLIDREYRTWPHREATAIGGYSMGGMMSLYTVLHYNSVFSKAAVISPALFSAMENFKAEIQQNALSPDTRIFLSWGDAEGSPEEIRNLSDGIRYLEKEVQKKEVRTYLLCQHGGHHNEQSWGQQVPTWMQFLWF